MSARGTTAALTLLAIFCVAGIVHVASLLVMPRVAPADAFARLAAAVPEGVVRDLPPATSPADPLEDRDPSVATAVCRYDLARGPLRVSATLGDAGFVALTLHARSGTAFYGLTDRANNEGRLDLVVMTPAQIAQARARDNPDVPVRDVRVVAPQREGFVSLDVLPRLGGPARAADDLGSMRCGVEHPA
jgi:uncharacterized membrane protein